MTLVGPDWRVVYLDRVSCLLLEGRIFRWTQLPPIGGTYI